MATPARQSRRQHRVVALGELVWDLFAAGARLGGAPANVAYHAAALGDRAALASRVGDDELGRRALAQLDRRGVNVSAVELDPSRPTGTVRVEIDRDGEPVYVIDETAAWTALRWTERAGELVRAADAICFGSLLQALPAGRLLLRRAVEAARPDAVRLLDLNLRPPLDTVPAVSAAIEAANAVKLNRTEAERLGRLHRLGGAAEVVGRWLVEQRGMRMVALTDGARGSVLFTPAGTDVRRGGVAAPANDSDSVGAGDAFAAALLHHLLRGSEASRCHEAAARYAAHVASRPGAMPPLPDVLREEVTR